VIVVAGTDVAGIAHTVTVGVHLRGVRNGQAVVHGIGDSIAVRVLACVADTVPVTVRLVCVGHGWAVVAGVTDTVPVGIGLIRVREETIVRGVGDTVPVAIAVRPCAAADEEARYILSFADRQRLRDSVRCRIHDDDLPRLQSRPRGIIDGVHTRAIGVDADASDPDVRVDGGQDRIRGGVDDVNRR